MQVLWFFAQQGLSLRQRYPVMLVDGDTLDGERKVSKKADEQAPVFHTLGLCMQQGDGHVKHVVHSQPGFSSLYKQPSLNATLRPADLAEVEWKVRICLGLACSADCCSVYTRLAGQQQASADRHGPVHLHRHIWSVTKTRLQCQALTCV